MALQHTFGELRSQLAKRIIGQEKLVDRLLIALLADGHLLVEGAPGLAKTTAIKALADHLEGDFHRIQFTPDLLPSDVTGSEIYRAETGQFEFQHGPIFHNLVLADEINRAPAKVQSALLEAMGERQVSVGMRTFPLDRLFMVMATQNPIEQEGTYPLPEAQLDRFLMHVVIDYPSAVAEKEILHLARNDYRRGQVAAEVRLTAEQVFEARHAVSDIYMSEPVEQYLLALVPRRHSTRNWPAGPPSEPAHEAPSRWTAAPEPWRGWKDGTTSARTMCGTLPSTFFAIVFC